MFSLFRSTFSNPRSTPGERYDLAQVIYSSNYFDVILQGKSQNKEGFFEQKSRSEGVFRFCFCEEIYFSPALPGWKKMAAMP